MPNELTHFFFLMNDSVFECVSLTVSSETSYCTIEVTLEFAQSLKVDASIVLSCRQQLFPCWCLAITSFYA